MIQPVTFYSQRPLRPVVVPWKCDLRGDCCRIPKIVTMSTQERDAILAAVSVGVASTLRWRDDPTPGFVQLQARPCPLLTPDGLCSVYAVRPMNCRRFMCGRVGDEEWESGPNGSCLNLEDRLDQSREFRRDYAKNQRKAQKWGLKHGWVDDAKP